MMLQNPELGHSKLVQIQWAVFRAYVCASTAGKPLSQAHLDTGLENESHASVFRTKLLM